jgi:hypothetical protein
MTYETDKLIQYFQGGPEPENLEHYPLSLIMATGFRLLLEKKKRKSPQKISGHMSDRLKIFRRGLAGFSTKYTPEMLKKFYDYWTEVNRSGSKMRYELEKTWDTSKRLATWASRDNGFTKSKIEKSGALPMYKPVVIPDSEIATKDDMKQMRKEKGL